MSSPSCQSRGANPSQRLPPYCIVSPPFASRLTDPYYFPPKAELIPLNVSLLPPILIQNIHSAEKFHKSFYTFVISSYSRFLSTHSRYFGFGVFATQPFDIFLTSLSPDTNTTYQSHITSAINTNMRSTTFKAAVLFSALSLAQAQTFTDCDPTKKSKQSLLSKPERGY